MKRYPDELICGLDSLHGILYLNLDNEDKVFAYCLACNYKVYIGLNHYDKMKVALNDTIKSTR